VLNMEASLRELNVHGSALARRAQAGETIVITDRGRPIAELVPHTSVIRFAHRDQVLADLTGLARESFAEFRAQLDALADPYFDVERV